MKILITCVLMMSLNSCYRESAHLRQRHREIESYMLDRSKAGPEQAYQIRGPLTLAEAEKELCTMFKDSDHLVERDSSGNPTKYIGPSWIRLVNRFETNDELYHYRSGLRRSMHLQGSVGYVLFRSEKLVAEYGYGMN